MLPQWLLSLQNWCRLSPDSHGLKMMSFIQNMLLIWKVEYIMTTVIPLNSTKLSLNADYSPPLSHDPAQHPAVHHH